MRLSELIEKIENDHYKDTFISLYGDNYEFQKERYLTMLNNSLKYFVKDDEVHLLSSPGRCEIGGNHTDHQLGRVLAASINLDVIGIIKRNNDMTINYYSDGFNVKPVDLRDLSIIYEEKNTTEAIIRGINSKLKENNHIIGGFDAYAESNVSTGSGLSSSAAFEIFIGAANNILYNKNEIKPVELAQIGQYAENTYFMKASGLMDQVACAYGNCVYINFADEEYPEIEVININLDDYSYDLIVTNTNSSHDDLSDEYSAIPTEMKGVALQMNEQVLSPLSLDDLIDNVDKVRKNCGDRAFLRAYHFMNETERVFDEAEALKANDFEYFLDLVNASGKSSWMYLQNVLIPSDKIHQELGVALALSDAILGDKGAYRVHGGGFAGTILAFVPQDASEEYIETMEKAFGKDCCLKLKIRNKGYVDLTKGEEEHD